LLNTQGHIDSEAGEPLMFKVVVVVGIAIVGDGKLRMEHLKAFTASSKPTRSTDQILFLEKFTDLMNLL